MICKNYYHKTIEMLVCIYAADICVFHFDCFQLQKRKPQKLIVDFVFLHWPFACALATSIHLGCIAPTIRDIIVCAHKSASMSTYVRHVMLQMILNAIDFDSFARLHSHEMHESKIAVGYSALFFCYSFRNVPIILRFNIHMLCALHSTLSSFKTSLNPIISYSATISYFNRYCIFLIHFFPSFEFFTRTFRLITNKVHILITNKVQLAFKRWKMCSA